MSASETRKRRAMSSSSGFFSSARVTVRGSSAIPQTGHGPGFVSRTSGSMGHTYSTRSPAMRGSTRSPAAGAGGADAGPGALIAAADGPACSQCSGLAAKRSRQRGLQKW